MKLSKKYILVVLLSILIFPISFFGVNLTYYLFVNALGSFSDETFVSSEDVEMYIDEKLHTWSNKRNEEIISGFNELESPIEFDLHWISDSGMVLYSSEDDFESNWDTTAAIDFATSQDNNGLYTNFSYLEGSEDRGYIILQIPEDRLGTKWDVLEKRYTSFWYLFLASIWIIFVYITWLFFKRTSNRLTKMQLHMEQNQNTLIPSKMVIEKKDEIGALEESFNLMVDDLQESHQNEEKERLIRKRLIASLSHDLRTPLSIINGHAHKMREYELNETVNESLDVITKKVIFLGELIDNLSSYTVLSEGKMPISLKRRDIVPLIKNILIDWYPIFERNDFKIDIDVTNSIYWEIDEVWLSRIMNNLLQNVLRHAGQGKYLGVKTQYHNGEYALLIVDHGSGFEWQSDNKGEGIGLSIVAMMVEQMNLAYDIISTKQGTTVKITT